MIKYLFNSLKFRYKLLVSFSIILVLFIGTSFVVYDSNNRTRHLSNKVEQDVYPTLQYLNKIIADFRLIGELYASAITFKNASKIEKVQDVRVDLNKNITSLKDPSIVKPEKSKEISELLTSYMELADKIAKAMVAGIDFMSLAPDLSRLGETTRKINNILGELQKQIRAEMKMDLRAIDHLTYRTTKTMLFITTLVVLLAIALSFFVTSMITQPIFALINAMDRVKEGDISTEITIHGKDEIAIMGRHFNFMIAGLKERDRIRDTSKRYVAHSIVDEVLKSPEKLELGGEIRFMTVMFSDITRFTNLSEKMPPSDLVAFLNGYFEEMVGIVLDHRGTFDKFEGDLIMAFWGAPVKQEDHAVLACHASLAMQKRICEMQGEWTARNLPPLRVRTGLNSGEMLVGNLGTETIMSYTVMGDAVNLGSRLESAGKQYGVPLIISDSTVYLGQGTH